VFCGANSSRPTGSFRQRHKTLKAAKRALLMDEDKENKQKS
jgi:hypothetical protein